MFSNIGQGLSVAVGRRRKAIQRRLRSSSREHRRCVPRMTGAAGSPMSADTSQVQWRPVGSPAEAELLVRHMIDVMDALLGTIEEETELVRAGKLGEASRLDSVKTELSRLYIADCVRIKANQSYLSQVVPVQLADLHKRYDLFRALLPMNLTVLEATHAILEGVMRGVPRERGHQTAPQAYAGTARSQRRPSAAIGR
jgi:hypothetical protein